MVHITGLLESLVNTGQACVHKVFFSLLRVLLPIANISVVDAFKGNLPFILLLLFLVYQFCANHTMQMSWEREQWCFCCGSLPNSCLMSPLSSYIYSAADKKHQEYVKLRSKEERKTKKKGRSLQLTKKN